MRAALRAGPSGAQEKWEDWRTRADGSCGKKKSGSGVLRQTGIAGRGPAPGGAGWALWTPVGQQHSRAGAAAESCRPLCTGLSPCLLLLPLGFSVLASALSRPCHPFIISPSHALLHLHLSATAYLGASFREIPSLQGPGSYIHCHCPSHQARLTKALILDHFVCCTSFHHNTTAADRGHGRQPLRSRILKHACSFCLQTPSNTSVSGNDRHQQPGLAGRHSSWTRPLFVPLPPVAVVGG